MNKTELLKLWDKMFKSKLVKKDFRQMAMAHDGDGWRDLILEKGNICIRITLERNPCGYLIYSGECRYNLGKIKGDFMRIAFDKRGTLEEVSVERLDELLK